MIKLHHLRPAPGAKTKKTRVGRGIAAGKGKTAGRGTKGTKARRQVRVGFEGGQMPLHMRLPKKRGFKNPFHIQYQVINLAKLQELYPAGGDVTIDDLVQNGVVRDQSLIKILGTGEITVALNIQADAVSKSALEKIEKVGGKVTIIDLEADDLDE
jgi:large subunit ribosomal protein L15